jgi:hypothetical protein
MLAPLMMLLLSAPPTLGGCQVLPANHIFNTDISALPVHPNSAAFLATISAAPRKLHLDLGAQMDQSASDFYGIPYQVVTGSTVAWKKIRYQSQGSTQDAAADESDCANAQRQKVTPCDNTPEAYFPFGASPLVEGGIQTNQAIYGDHHVLVLDAETCALWEAYHCYPNTVGGWDVLSTAMWALGSNDLRTATWTSADAAGFPILPLLLRGEEADLGAINHALRFTIESTKIRNTYTWPATHKTNNGGSSQDKPQMGQLFRLKASYNAPDAFTPKAKAIVKALKTYGMYIADGGSDMYITGAPSPLWDDDTIADVQRIDHTNFEAVDLTPVTSHPEFVASSAAVPAAFAVSGNTEPPVGTGTPASGGGLPATSGGSTNPGGAGGEGNPVRQGCAQTHTGAVLVLVLSGVVVLRASARRRYRK